MRKLTFQELRQEYLLKLYEMSEGNPFREIKLNELHKQLQSSNEQQLGIISQFRKEGLVTYTFGLAMITPDGIIEVEKRLEENRKEGKRYSDSMTQIIPTQVNYHNTFNAPLGAFQQDTRRSTQSVNQSINTTDNSNFMVSLKSILKLIKTSLLSDDGTIEVIVARIGFLILLIIVLVKTIVYFIFN